MAYRTITGHALDLSAVSAGSPADRRAVVGSLAAALAAVHKLSLPAISVPVLDTTRCAQAAREVRATLVRRLRARLDRLLDAWDGTVLSQPCSSPVLLHGDFYPGNMVFTGPAGALAGLWDFSCVERGDPAADLRYLVGDSAVLAGELADVYRALTGRTLDLQGARLIRWLEDIADAVEEGRSLDRILSAWGR